MEELDAAFGRRFSSPPCRETSFAGGRPEHEQTLTLLEYSYLGGSDHEVLNSILEFCNTSGRMVDLVTPLVLRPNCRCAFAVVVAGSVRCRVTAVMAQPLFARSQQGERPTEPQS